MEPDFKGWATKVGILCTDGRTIMSDAFKHQDKCQVPLVWQHGHTDAENVLGHAILENRPEGVYASGFFNSSAKGQHMKSAVSHGDIQFMSIWANQVIEKSKRVIHGMIREVSLVLSGANPGARIEHVAIRHSDGDEEVLDDEVIIHTGLAFSLDNSNDDNDDNDEEDISVRDVYESMTDKQKKVVHYFIGEVLSSEQDIKQDAIGNSVSGDSKKEDVMAHNVFEKTKKNSTSLLADNDSSHIISHDDMQVIFADAAKSGSLKSALEQYVISHGIQNIDVLFPEAQAVGDVQTLSRDMGWVSSLLSGTTKTPFSRIKTRFADITMDEARARGYVTGNVKREEFFALLKRITTPTTVYKKQKLDRDDMLDITELDVVPWIKKELRVMLDEELARAILIGDGRDVVSPDKISEDNIRPVAKEHPLYATRVVVNLSDANSSYNELLDSAILNRKHYKGTGLPTFYTTETVISNLLVLKDGMGRRLYKSVDEIATDLRVTSLVPVEVMEGEDNLLGIMLNPVDYVVGADRGGQVSIFDDFDIDFNQYKYLIETRMSGALAKLKSALVFEKLVGALTLVVPAAPAKDEYGEIVITNTAGVSYKNMETGAVMTAAGGPYVIPVGASITVVAEPTAGNYFASTADTVWTFVAESR